MSRLSRHACQCALVALLAVSTVACASKLSPEDQKAFDGLVDALDHVDNVERVEQGLQQLQWRYPRNPDVLVQLARVQLDYATGAFVGRPPRFVLLPSAQGYPQDVTSPRNLELAEGLVQKALSLDERNVLALAYRGDILHLRKEFDQALQVLEQARTLDPDNMRVHAQTAEVLWSRAVASPEPAQDMRVKYGPTIAAYERAARGRGPATLRASVQGNLGELYAIVGDLDRADASFTAGIDGSDGDRNRSNAYFRRARHRLERLGHVDDALRDIEQARRDFDTGMLNDLHARALLVKAGQQCAPDCTPAAREMIREARSLGDPWKAVQAVQYAPAVLPAIHTLREAGVVDEWSDPRLGKLLASAVPRAPASAVEDLLTLGIDPNPSDDVLGNALHNAIFFRRADVVEVLLAHGADPTIPVRDGRTPLELTDSPQEQVTADIRDLLIARVGGERQFPPPAPIEIPFQRDARYRALVGLGKTRDGFDVPAGSILYFQQECGARERDEACLLFLLELQNDPENSLQAMVQLDIPRDGIGRLEKSLRLEPK